MIDPNSLSVQEIKSIISVVEKIKNNNGSKLFCALKRLHVIALICSVGILIEELFMSARVSEFLHLTQFDSGTAYFASVFIASLLILLVFFGYLILVSQAKKEELSVSSFMERFKVVKRAALLSDLFLMLLFLVTVIMLGKGVWVPALLTLFLGHFLIQGHIFKFSFKNTNILGLVCCLLAGILFIFKIQSIGYPLVLFISICSLSLIGIIIQEKKKNG